MTKLHISFRNARGQMQSVDPANVPEGAPDAVKAAAAAIMGAVAVGLPDAALTALVDSLSAKLAEAEVANVALSNANLSLTRQVTALMATAEGEAPPKGKRGRPAGYKCSPETVARMTAGRVATMARKRAEREGQAAG
jgi:hypothetical protein